MTSCSTIELSAFDFGGQRYLPIPDKVPAELEITRATTGTVFTLAFTARLYGPCYRCLGDAVLELQIRAREYQDEAPEDEEMRTEYVEGNNIDLSAWARRDCTRPARADRLPRRLRRPLCRMRQEPERRATHARGAAQRPTLGRARSAPRRLLTCPFEPCPGDSPRDMALLDTSRDCPQTWRFRTCPGDSPRYMAPRYR